MEKVPNSATRPHPDTSPKTFADPSVEDESLRPVQWDRNLHLTTRVALLHDELAAAGMGSDCRNRLWIEADFMQAQRSVDGPQVFPKHLVSVL